jgi:hypothetical protein
MQIQQRCRVTVPRVEHANGRSLACAMVTVSADEHVLPPDPEIAPWLEIVLIQQEEGKERGVGRILRAGGNDLAA